MGRKNLDKCDALYCRDDAMVSIHQKTDDGKEAGPVKLCERHWIEHCDDLTIKLSDDRVFPPAVCLTTSGEIDLIKTTKSRGADRKERL